MNRTSLQQRPFFFFFGLHLNLGAMFRTEVELLISTKLCQKRFHPLGIWLINRKSTPMSSGDRNITVLPCSNEIVLINFYIFQVLWPKTSVKYSDDYIIAE